MAIIFVRTVILYFAILISMRIMGKRQLGEMEISEFIVAALIADLAATPLQDIGIPLLNGLVPIIIMFCFEIIIAGLNMRSIKLRKLTYGRPEIIIRNGRIIREAMQKNRFTLDELMQELRAQGLTDTAQVEYAVLETNGQLSIILKSGDQPATASQMGCRRRRRELRAHHNKRGQDTRQQPQASRPRQTLAFKRAETAEFPFRR